MLDRRGLRRHAGRLRLLSAGVLALAIAGCGGGGGGGSSTGATAPATHTATPPHQKAQPPFTATLKTPSTPPHAGKGWPITITVKTKSGKPLKAKVLYEFLYSGQVVARCTSNPKKKQPCPSGYTFTGTLHDKLMFPARAAGLPITFRAIVKTKLGTRNLDHAVQVRR